MPLEVLYNISAMYAANAISNTSASLQKVLQELSSGSRINSASDDPAGISFVASMQANIAALAQSATNIDAGVGLLQVADGALSQVNSLLNRAITLATEASNGTLTSTQTMAANQEYASILAEINNIGSTTTFNSQQIFTGSAAGTEIYSGDSTAMGAAIMDVYFAALGSSTVGDAGGSVVQSSAGTFVDLSNNSVSAVTMAATGSDAISGSLTFTIHNAGGGVITVSTTSTTVSALISEINTDGITGVAASLTTSGAVGDTANAASGAVGILISNTNTSVTITNNALKDNSDLQTAQAAFASTQATQTISYQTGSQETSANLAATDLNNAADARSALKGISAAIGYVSAQRGYLGGQLNMLKAEQQNDLSEEQTLIATLNAFEGTDYAQATSDLAKYEILMQTGISALAQAISMGKEVTKLLQ
jgi:flagellin